MTRMTGLIRIRRMNRYHLPTLRPQHLNQLMSACIQYRLVQTMLSHQIPTQFRNRSLGERSHTYGIQFLNYHHTGHLDHREPYDDASYCAS